MCPRALTAAAAGSRANHALRRGHAQGARANSERARTAAGHGRGATSTYLVMSFFSNRCPDLMETTGSEGTSPLSAQTSADMLNALPLPRDTAGSRCLQNFSRSIMGLAKIWRPLESEEYSTSVGKNMR